MASQLFTDFHIVDEARFSGNDARVPDGRIEVVDGEPASHTLALTGAVRRRTAGVRSMSRFRTSSAGTVLRSAMVLAALVIAAAPAVAAPPLELDGRLVQGGLVIGRTVPGAEVRLADRDVRVTSEGVFLLGFGRDAEPAQALVVEAPDGGRLRRELEIAPREYDLQRVDGVPPRTVSPPEEALPRIREEVRIVREARRRDDPRTGFLADFSWPVRGRITGFYGSQRIYNGEPGRPHYGIDIAAPAGTTVTAPAPGVVTVAHPDMYFSGGTVLLDHGHGLSSAFLHLRSLTVEKGDRLEQGEAIGEVGAGGRATGAHLDWRVNWFDRRLDAARLAGPMPEDGR